MEFNTSSGELSRKLLTEPLRLENGAVRVPHGPGLAVTVDEDFIAAYTVG